MTRALAALVVVLVVLPCALDAAAVASDGVPAAAKPLTRDPALGGAAQRAKRHAAWLWAALLLLMSVLALAVYRQVRSLRSRGA